MIVTGYIRVKAAREERMMITHQDAPRASGAAILGPVIKSWPCSAWRKLAGTSAKFTVVTTACGGYPPVRHADCSQAQVAEDALWSGIGGAYPLS